MPTLEEITAPVSALADRLRNVDERIENLKEERERLRSELKRLMDELGLDKVSANRVNATLYQSRAYNPDKIRTLAELLPPDQFSKLFRPETVTPERINSAAVTRLRKSMFDHEVHRIIDDATSLTDLRLVIRKKPVGIEENQDNAK